MFGPYEDVEVRVRAPTEQVTRTTKEPTMKYLLMIYLNPAGMEALSEDEQQAVMKAHDDFQALTRVRRAGRLRR
jgi:hypothetical protein